MNRKISLWLLIVFIFSSTVFPMTLDDSDDDSEATILISMDDTDEDEPDFLSLDIGISEVACTGRTHGMQDAHIVLNLADKFQNCVPTDSLFAVYDGHGGDFVSKELARCMPTMVLQALGCKKDISHMDEKFHDIYFACHQSFATTKHQGSSALTALLVDKQLVIAHSGGSRAIWGSFHPRALVYATEEHTPSRADERLRVLSERGIINYRASRSGTTNIARVGGIYRLSRSLGDYPHVAGMTYAPEIYTVQLDNAYDFLILASSGLWHAVSNETAKQIVHQAFVDNYAAAAQIAADTLKRVAIQGRDTHDDVTIIVVIFNWMHVQN